jgi:DNA gyrase subunit A
MQENREQISPINIEDELKTSYIDYAMSVIVGRALPDVRDGLKPVHRRVIFAMHEKGFGPTSKTEKSAKTVGEVMGNFHPHGDSAIYDALVRMAQDFSMRYQLIDGQGNFGSVDGDPAAAMRYTESRLSKFAMLLLEDLEKNTVDFQPNYDASRQEPTVLPAAFPNLLVNGSTGIAVGMATSIPPHNLREVINACILMIDNPSVGVKELLEVMPGPDFPTGGYICGRKGILDAYEKGRGKLAVRAKMSTEQLKGQREAIIVSEIPYQVNKSRLIEEIAHLVRDKRLTGISELRDESDREGMRIVIELKKGEVPEVIINNLYKHTQLQVTFGVIMLALVKGRPRYLTLPQMIHYFLEHRREVVVRRTRFDLDRAEKRLHIVHGLIVVQTNIDRVIEIIRGSESPDEAKRTLMATFRVPLEMARQIDPDVVEAMPLSPEQAQAILEMRLSRLTKLEKNRLFEEAAGLVNDITRFRKILGANTEVWRIVRTELLAIRDKFGDDRRTQIVEDPGDLSIEDLIADERMVITISHGGYMKRTSTDLYRRQKRGGKGITAAETKEEDFIEHMFVGTTHNYLMFFTERGQAYWLKIYEIPEGGRASKGRPIVNLLELPKGDRVMAVLPVVKFNDTQFLMFSTRRGIVCRQALSHYDNPRKAGIKAINIEDGDELVDVKLTSGQSEVVLATRKGMAVRFHETDVRSTGRFTGGVKGITLGPDDVVIGMEIPRPGATLLTVCEHGFGKRSDIEDYRETNRGAKGVINIKTSTRNGHVVAIKEVVNGEELIMVTRNGISIRCKVDDVRQTSRNTMGVTLIRVEEGDSVVGVARMAKEYADDLNDETEGTEEGTETVTPE